MSSQHSDDEDEMVVINDNSIISNDSTNDLSETSAAGGSSDNLRPPTPPPKPATTSSPPTPPKKDNERLSNAETSTNVNAFQTNSSSDESFVPSVKGQKFVLNGSGTQVYVTQRPDQRPDRMLILLTNSLGLSSTNNLKLADTFSSRLNCPVLVPDLFDNDPIKVSGAEIPEDSNTRESATANPSNVSGLSKIKSFAVSFIKGFMDEMWLAKHTFDRTYPHLADTISELIQVYKPRSVGVIGYSFGGRYVLSLLQDQRNNEWSSDEDLIAVGACINPSLVELQDFETVGKPLLIVHSATNSVLSEDLVAAGVSKLTANNVEVQDTMLEGIDGSETSASQSDVNLTTPALKSVQPLPHGFAVPGDYPESVVGDRPLQVIDAVEKWINKHM